MFNHKVVLKATVTRANPGPESTYAFIEDCNPPYIGYTKYIEPFKSTSQELALKSTEA